MRSPIVAVLSTILNWMALVLWFALQQSFPMFVYQTPPHTISVITFVLLFSGALLQTLFLLRNVRLAVIPQADAVQKAKKRPKTNVTEWVHNLDADDRRQLLRTMMEQSEDEANYR